MSEAPDRQSITRKDLLWSAGVLFAFAVGMIVRVTFWGEPGNVLHMKAQEGAMGLIYVAAALVGGAIIPTVAGIVRK